MQITQLLLADRTAVAQAVLAGLFGYLGLVTLLRFFGKGMLDQRLPSSYVLSIAYGGGLAGIAFLTMTSLLAGLAGYITLMTLRYLLLNLTARSPRADWLVNGRPTLVFYEGRYLWDVMKRHAIAEVDILAAMRNRHVLRPEKVWAVVYETNGDLSVLQHRPPGPPRILEGVENYPPPAGARRRPA